MSSIAAYPADPGASTNNCRRRNACIFILLLTLALLVRLGVWRAYLNQLGAFEQPDTPSYLLPGLQFLTDGSFSSFSRTPVYPLFLAILYKLVSPAPALLALFQLAVSLGTLTLCYCLAQRAFGRRAAQLAPALLALDLTSAISANQLLTETLFAFLLICCVLILQKILVRAQCPSERGGAGYIPFVLAGGGLSLLALCRPVAFLLFIPVAGWLFAAVKIEGRRLVPQTLCFCGLAMLLPLLWSLRNHAHTGEFFFTTISAADLYEYRAAWNVARRGNRPFEEVHAEFQRNSADARSTRGLNEGELARWQQAEALGILLGNPLLTLRQGAAGLVRMYCGISNADINRLAAPAGALPADAQSTSDEIPADAAVESLQRSRNTPGTSKPLWIAGLKIWALGYLLLNYCGVLIALLQLFRGRLNQQQRSIAWLLLIVIVYFTLFSIGAETYSRFRVPIAPLLCILSGLGWSALYAQVNPPIVPVSQK